MIYTDLSFGYEGVNKILKRKFSELISPKQFIKLNVKSITFINLRYFEVHEDYLRQGLINFLEMIDGFSFSYRKWKHSTTPFEVYGRFYLKANVKKELGKPSFMMEVIKEIIPAAIDNIKWLIKKYEWLGRI